jgi:hypothetical protein
VVDQQSYCSLEAYVHTHPVTQVPHHPDQAARTHRGFHVKIQLLSFGKTRQAPPISSLEFHFFVFNLTRRRSASASAKRNVCFTGGF